MLLDKINAEFIELNKIIENKGLFMSAPRLMADNAEYEKILLSMSVDIREISRIQVNLQNKNFDSKIVQEFRLECMDCIECIFKQYDEFVRVLSEKKQELQEKEEMFIEFSIRGKNEIAENLFFATTDWDKIRDRIEIASEIISRIIEETWEPLPRDQEESNVENIVIESETRSVSLNDVASDVGNLDNFFQNISLLMTQTQNQSNNIYLRRVETGSLVVAVSCAMQAAPIIAFIFWCVKLYQKAEKRYLDNQNNKLKVINESLNTAKEILKIDPDNKEADEAIQKCGVHLLNFLENNPTGTINGEYYDIGMEKPKIEDKEKSKN